MTLMLTSTRGDPTLYAFSEGILRGQATDGGLLVPQNIPLVARADIAALVGRSYAEVASWTLCQLGLDSTPDDIATLCAAAYTTPAYDTPHIAPVRHLQGNIHQLELWHGPTAAFKDMALQLMPHFFATAQERENESRRLRGDTLKTSLILAATSGDTGSAALAGYAHQPGVRVVAFFPAEGVSEVQARQMQCMHGDNVAVFAVAGDFDAIQSSVKQLFGDTDWAAELDAHDIRLTSANSINWGRLVPQICYYFWAYAELLRQGQLHMGEPMDIAVPSGNFGNLLAGFLAGRMGLPIGKCICGSNSNDVLTEFLRTGTYDISHRTLQRTPSPSMDILVSSNIERLLWCLTGDTGQTAQYMQQLATERRYTAGTAVQTQLQDIFYAARIDNDATLQTIRTVYEQTGELLCPHTAVGYAALQQYRAVTGSTTPTLLVATAHWSKFAVDVLRALTGVPAGAPLAADTSFAALSAVAAACPGVHIPTHIQELRTAPILHTQVIQSSPRALQDAVQEFIRA